MGQSLAPSLVLGHVILDPIKQGSRVERISGSVES
jgi:hypothetical protein